MGLAMKGERPAEIVGLARTMRERVGAAVDAAYDDAIDMCGTGGDRSGTFNISSVRVAGRRGVRRAGGQARQPVGVEPVRQRRRLRGARRAGRPRRRPSSSGCWTRRGSAFLFAPIVPPVDAPRGAGAPRARRPHGVQPARAADEPGRRRARQLVGVPRPELTELHRALAAAARIGARVGRARRRRPRRDLDGRLHEGLGVPPRRGEHVLPAPGRLRPAAGARPSRFAGGDARDERARSRATCSAAARGAPRDIVLLNAGGGAARRRRGADDGRRDRRWRPTPSTAARAAAVLAGDGPRVGGGARREPARRARPARRHRRGDAAGRWRSAKARVPGGTRRGGRRASGARGRRVRRAAGAAGRAERDRRVQAPLAEPRRAAGRLRRGRRSPRGYEAGGAAAISVLTEPTFFDGSLDDLRAVRARGRPAAAAEGLHRRSSTSCSRPGPRAPTRCC